MRKVTVSAFLFFIVALVASCAVNTQEPVSSTILLDKVDRTILGKDFSYPTDSPEVSSSILVLQPGAETGWHFHEAPMYAYVLDGTLEVTYSDAGVEKTNTYTAGDAIMEGLDVPHNGRNVGSAPVSILVVNIGSVDLENTVLLGD